MLGLLRGGDYPTFANEALLYYDKLYDKHFKNAEGTGGGGGERDCISVDVQVEEGDGKIDAAGVGRQLLEALRGVEAEAGARRGG